MIKIKLPKYVAFSIWYIVYKRKQNRNKDINIPTAVKETGKIISSQLVLEVEGSSLLELTRDAL